MLNKITNILKTYIAILIAISIWGAINYLILGKLQLCVFRAFCGLPCPGCGLTSAGLALCKLDWYASINYHLLFIPLVITLVSGSIPNELSKVVCWMNNQRGWHWTLLIIFLGYFVVRLVLYGLSGAPPMYYDEDNYIYLIYQKFCQK